jgi:hypothetical protein
MDHYADVDLPLAKEGTLDLYLIPAEFVAKNPTPIYLTTISDNNLYQKIANDIVSKMNKGKHGIWVNNPGYRMDPTPETEMIEEIADID